MTGIRDGEGRLIGTRLTDGTLLRFPEPIDTTYVPSPRWLAFVARDRARSRQFLTNKARAATVRAKALERHSNDQAGLATVTWLPRSNGVKHADVHLPKGS